MPKRGTSPTSFGSVWNTSLLVNFDYLQRNGSLFLEIEDMPVACCTAGKDAAKDIVVCFGRWATKDVDC